MIKSFAIALTVSLALMSAAEASTSIVNLNASSSSPNAGNSSPGYAYNPVNLSLAAGTYSVTLAGIAGGGLYDAYTVYAPGPGAYTESNFSVSLNNGASTIYNQASIGRYNTAAAALAAYSPVVNFVFTLNAAQTVSFYVDDTSYPYFGDDTGGVSLRVSSVPEPATLGLLAIGVVGIGFVARRRRQPIQFA